MNEMGVKMEVGEDDIYVFPTNELKAVNIKTMPYPGFATDLQQTITPLFSKATRDCDDCGYHLSKTCWSRTRIKSYGRSWKSD